MGTERVSKFVLGELQPLPDPLERLSVHDGNCSLRLHPCQAKKLATVQTVDEAKAIRDKAEAIRGHAKRARLGLSIQNRAAAIKILAEQQVGALLKAIKKAKGAAAPRGSSLEPRYKDLGLKKTQAHRWQTMATIPSARVLEMEPEKTAAGKELTSHLVYTLAKTTASRSWWRLHSPSSA